MKIEWLGHSSFKLTESTGTSVVTDPYHPYIGEQMPQVEADAVTVSHRHDDHNAVELVGGNPVVLDRTGAFEIKGVHIYSIMSYHDAKKGAIRGKNLVFKFRIDGVDICHLGDIGEELSPMLAELITPINVLFIPVGGKYTLNAEQAKEYVDFLMPDIVIPMHYANKDTQIDIASADDFVDLFDEDDVEYIKDNYIEFNRTDFDGERTRIIVLKHT
jgi:L-ascorbate metabolism protein UlaG (beta-lactamase superfamily)